jgi:uncharacterized protein
LKQLINGPVINAAGIVVAGICGWAFRKAIPPLYQLALKIVLGVYTIWFGLRLSWGSVNGSFRQVLKEILIVLLALTLGKIAGRLLHLQRLSNSIGQFATRTLAAQPVNTQFKTGFMVATALFCAGPLALLASVQEGLNGFSPLFVIKAATDGLAAYAFFSQFGWSVIVSALPVLALERALVELVHSSAPWMPHRQWPLADSILAVDGLLIFCVAMLILELKKIEVADYFPSLALAPLLTWWLW